MAKAPDWFQVDFTDRGVTGGPAYFSAKAVEQIVVRAATESFPAHVQSQIRARRKMLQDIIHHQIERAVNSDRYLVEIQMRAMGFNDAADFLRVERITK